MTQLTSDPQPRDLAAELRAFDAFGRRTEEGLLEVEGVTAPTFTNEFWTKAQREGHSLHEVSYRACFKPSLPAFFIDRLSRPGDRVLDPFMGRGTTPLEACLRGRVPCGNDVNPLSEVLLRPRLAPPMCAEVEARVDELDLSFGGALDEDLLVFFHPKTLRGITALREHFRRREQEGALDEVDAWLRMVAVNRLTGHSSGFFSVYTLPPNQATSVAGQRRINAKRRQVPPERDVRRVLLKKSRALLADLGGGQGGPDRALAEAAVLTTGPAAKMAALPTAGVQLVVTSPPFLDVVQYADDNWLRCWFCGVDVKSVPITMARSVEAWREAMRAVFVELWRVVRPGGYVAFEVGEVKRGKVRLEEHVLPVAADVGFAPELVLLHTQDFTKTARCWGVENNRRGTNTNRVVVLQRP